MGGYSFSNFGKGLRTVALILALPVAILLYKGGSNIMKNAYSREHQEKNASIIYKLLKSNDPAKIEKATSAFQTICARKGFSIEDSLNIEIELKKSRLETEFFGQIASNNFSGAESIYMQIKVSGLYNLEQISSFEKKINLFNEENLFNEIISSDLEGRSELSEKYLSLHQNGQHRGKVIRYLFLDNLGVLSGKLRIKAQFSELMPQINKLNQMFEKYSKEKIDVSSSSLNSILNRADNLLSLDSLMVPAEDLKEGDLVKVFNSESNQFWTEEYSSQRNDIIPMNSVGIVKKIDNPHHILIEIKSQTKGTWSENWEEFVKYYKETNHNFAYYREDELLSVANIGEKTIFKDAVEKLRSNVEALR
jgi:hypothetical protein